MPPKIFGIGFHKTGTKSLAAALTSLGYRVTGPNGVNDPAISSNVLAMAHALVPLYDAFQDNPWPLLYQELDVRYPGSKFILTLRSPDSWIRSQLRYFGARQTPMRQWIYGFGCPEGNEGAYLARYQRHNEEVAAYFHGRRHDLLTMDLDVGYGWGPLCEFLGKEVPDFPFPHVNVTREPAPRLPVRE